MHCNTELSYLLYAKTISKKFEMCNYTNQYYLRVNYYILLNY